MLLNNKTKYIYIYIYSINKKLTIKNHITLMHKYSIIIFIKNLNNLSCLSSYKIIFFKKKLFIIIFKFSKLANIFPIFKRENKRIQIYSNFQQVSYPIKSITLKNFKYSFFFIKILNNLSCKKSYRIIFY